MLIRCQIGVAYGDLPLADLPGVDLAVGLADSRERRVEVLVWKNKQPLREDPWSYKQLEDCVCAKCDPTTTSNWGLCLCVVRRVAQAQWSSPRKEESWPPMQSTVASDGSSNPPEKQHNIDLKHNIK